MPSVDKWIKKKDVICEYYLTIKKKKILPFVTHGGEPRGLYAKTNKTKKDGYCMVSLIHGV